MTNSKERILIVDDDPFTIEILASFLGHDYTINVAKNGEEGLALASSVPSPDLILLDVMMPEMDGYEVCRQLKQSRETRDIPVIFVSAKDGDLDEEEGLKIGAADYITKTASAPIVTFRVRNQIQLALARSALEKQNEILERKVVERTREITQTQDATILTLATLAETRDSDTGNHIRRTQSYIRAIVEELATNTEFEDQLDDQMIEVICKSAPLHDIGKVGVPDAILNKPGKLTTEEFEVMKSHTTLGYEALQSAEAALGENSFLEIAKQIALTHHEKWDGSGYPDGLIGKSIPLTGRIMAVADVYDALISKRAYKQAFTHQEALKVISDGSGSHFDPDIVKIFCQIEQQIAKIADELPPDPRYELTSDTLQVT